MKRGINKGLLAVGALTGVTVLTGAVLSRPVVKADGLNTDDVTITIQTSCTITVDQSESSQHSAKIENGRAVSDIGVTRMGAYCNDKNGYYIYAVGSSGDTDGNTALLSSIGNDFNIATGTATSGNTSNWAMKITGGEGTTAPTVVNAFKNYRAVPETYTVVAHRDSGTEMSPEDLETSGSYIDTTYQTYVTSTQPAGTYRGKVKYTLVHPFDPTKLISINEAFRIAGKTKVTVGGKEYYKMQDMTPAICDMVTVLGDYSKAQLVDTRDNSIYWVAKLGDDNNTYSNCWMTQNLELDLDSTAVADSANALTSENTNLKTYGVNGYDSNNGYSCSNVSTTSNCTDTGEVITWVPARTTVTELISGENSNFPNTTAANSTSYSYNPGDKYYYPTSATGDTSYTLAECESHNYTDCAHYKAGNYYNWSASVASNNTSSYTGNNTDAGNSVCPKGWRLPKKSANEFQSLVDAYGITATNALNLRNSPLYFVRSGDVNGGSLNNAASSGYYWSSTVNGASDAYDLVFNSGGLNPANYNNRYLGFPVRCVAE